MTIKRLITAALLLCAALGCEKRPSDGLFVPLKPSVTKLPSGGEVFLLEDHEFPTLQVHVYVRGGSVYDPPGKEGLAAIAMQSVRLGGAEGREPLKIEEDLEFVGASLEMGAAAESLSAALSLLAKDADLGLDILFDLLRRPALDPSRFSIVKERAKDALLREEEDPLRLAMREFPGLVYGEASPWGGKATPESIDRITLEDVRTFCREAIRPDRLLIAVSGDVAESEIAEAIRRRVEGWEKAAQGLSEIPPVKEEYSKKVVIRSRKDLTQSTVVVGHLGSRRDNPDKFALVVMNFILGGSGSLTSRLGEEIRSTAGKAYGVWSDYGFGRDLGLFRALAQTSLENTAWVTHKMEDMIVAFHEGVKEGATLEETDKAKKAILRSLIFDFETRFAQVKEQVRFRLLGYPDDYLVRFQKGIAAVTPKEVQRVAKSYLHPEGLKTLIVTEEGEAGKLESELGGRR